MARDEGAELTQKLAQLQPFIAVLPLPTGTHGPTCTFRANLTPLLARSLQQLNNFMSEIEEKEKIFAFPSMGALGLDFVTDKRRANAVSLGVIKKASLVSAFEFCKSTPSCSSVAVRRTMI